MPMRVRNISEGYVDGSGVFHPIRSATDYKTKRSGEKPKAASYGKAPKKRAKKAKRMAKKRTTTTKRKRNPARRRKSSVKKVSMNVFPTKFVNAKVRRVGRKIQVLIKKAGRKLR